MQYAAQRSRNILEKTTAWKQAVRRTPIWSKLCIDTPNFGWKWAPDGQKQVFVKWSKLHYDALTWEACDLDPQELKQALDQYHSLTEYQSVELYWKLKRRSTNQGVQAKTSVRRRSMTPYLTRESRFLKIISNWRLNWMIWNWQNNRNSILADEMGLGKLANLHAFYSTFGHQAVGKKSLRDWSISSCCTCPRSNTGNEKLRHGLNYIVWFIMAAKWQDKQL